MDCGILSIMARDGETSWGRGGRGLSLNPFVLNGDQGVLINDKPL